MTNRQDGFTGRLQEVGPLLEQAILVGISIVLEPSIWNT